MYQEVLKSAVKSHIQGTKVLLSPFFLHNPLAAFLSQGGLAAQAGKDEGFELQVAFAPPMRLVLPRFPLLPVAMSAGLVYSSSSELDARLGLSSDAVERAARARAAAADQSGGAVSSLMQQVGSGLGSLGLLGGGWGSSKTPGAPVKPQAV